MGENPTIFGPGWDFGVLWNVGRAILTGHDPYAVFGSFYPPATSYLFVIFALVPVGVGYALWTAANIGFLLRAVGIRRALAWVLFVPMFMVIAAGQVDAAFLALATFLPSRGWKSVAAAALITLKPQVALLLLPIWLLRWLLSDRRRLGAFVVATATLHAWPLLLDPTIGTRWIERLSSGIGLRAAASPGLWSLYSGQAGWAFGLAAFALMAVGLLSGREWISRAANVMALPVGFFYDTVVLTGSAPAWLLVPLSWATLGLAHAVGAYWPMVLIPLAAFLWGLGGRTTLRVDRRSPEAVAILGRWRLRIRGARLIVLTPMFGAVANVR